MYYCIIAPSNSILPPAKDVLLLMLIFFLSLSIRFDELLFKRAPPRCCKGFFDVNIPMKVKKKTDKLPERVVVAPPFFGQ